MRKTYFKLLEVEKLVMNPATFCKGTYAKDSKGFDVDAEDAAACRFCILGAIEKVGNSMKVKSDLRVVINESILGYFGQPKSIPVLNDSYSRKDRQEVFNIAKAKLKENI